MESSVGPSSMGGDWQVLGPATRGRSQIQGEVGFQVMKISLPPRFDGSFGHAVQVGAIQGQGAACECSGYGVYRHARDTQTDQAPGFLSFIRQRASRRRGQGSEPIIDLRVSGQRSPESAPLA